VGCEWMQSRGANRKGVNEGSSRIDATASTRRELYDRVPIGRFVHFEILSFPFGVLYKLILGSFTSRFVMSSSGLIFVLNLFIIYISLSLAIFHRTCFCGRLHQHHQVFTPCTTIGPRKFSLFSKPWAMLHSNVIAGLIVWHSPRLITPSSAVHGVSSKDSLQGIATLGKTRRRAKYSKAKY
jgi:hypothetical protein